MRSALDMKDVWLSETGNASRALSMEGSADFFAYLERGAASPIDCQ